MRNRVGKRRTEGGGVARVRTRLPSTGKMGTWGAPGGEPSPGEPAANAGGAGFSAGAGAQEIRFAGGGGARHGAVRCWAGAHWEAGNFIFLPYFTWVVSFLPKSASSTRAPVSLVFQNFQKHMSTIPKNLQENTLVL